MRRLLETAEARALAILSDNRDHLRTIVTRLQAEETIEGDDLADLLADVVHAPDAGGNGSAAKKRAGAAATSR